MIQPEKIVVSEIIGGQDTYSKPFFIDNGSFPRMVNALCHRKSLIKKPGSTFLGRLQWNIGSTDSSGNATITIDTTGNVQAINSGISQFQIGSSLFLDQGGANPVTLTNVSGTGTAVLDRETTILTVTGSDASTDVMYFPVLPVLGEEAFESDKTLTTPIDFPINVWFDQRYAYQFNGNFYSVSYYKLSGNLVTWSGPNFRQFFSCNYYRAMFVTNNTPGMKFGWAHAIANQSSMTITIQIYDAADSIALTTLVVGDQLFFNEGTASGTFTLNGTSGKITDASSSDTGTYVVTFNSSQTISGYNPDTSLIQLLTSSASGDGIEDVGDGIRWYDGDPSGVSGLGWVNFAPPLDNLMSSATTYLVGARMIVSFGNRLLALGTFEATSDQIESPTYYGNRIRYCEVSATPFYAQPTPRTLPDTTSTPSISPFAWASNIQGFGGFIDLDTTERIISAAVTQGSLVIGLEAEQRRMTNTGIETDPFILETINPEYGTAGTFAIIPMDEGILTAGEYGFLATSSFNSQRFDEKIIDTIFTIDANNNGFDRICGARDFKNEVIYFTFCSDSSDASNIYPNQTVVYNYREKSFATWTETFTTYGIYKVQTTQTWLFYYTPWEEWTDKWEDLGGDQYEEPLVCGGTPQGYVMLKWNDTSRNEPSMLIQNITISGQTASINSPSHNLNTGMYIGLWEGLPSSSVNNPEFIAQVVSITDQNNFVAEGTNAVWGNVVPGIWQISIVDQINILTRQFPTAWGIARKTRVGTQRYFLDRTAFGEFTVFLLGSQSSVPLNSNTNTIPYIFSSIVRTRPDDSLYINNAQNQTQIWHRLSSSAIGDTIQLQFTLSDAQMQDINIATSDWVLYAFVLDVYPSRVLA